MRAPQKSIRADVLDRVIGVTDHDLTGYPRCAGSNGIWITADRSNVIQNPFLVTAFLFHVLDHRVLVALVGGTRCGQRKESKGVLHMVVGFSKEVDVKAA